MLASDFPACLTVPGASSDDARERHLRRQAFTDFRGYVAIEKVTGKLHGREGNFVLQHSATMKRGAPSLSVTIIPDSGTGALAGISGSLDIIIEKKQHSYTLDYSLGDSHG